MTVEEQEFEERVLEELLVSIVVLVGLSRMLRFSVWVGVTTVVMLPAQLPVSSLKKLGFLST